MPNIAKKRGVKRIYGERLRESMHIRLTLEHIEYLRSLYGDNISSGVRSVIEEHYRAGLGERKESTD